MDSPIILGLALLALCLNEATNLIKEFKKK